MNADLHMQPDLKDTGKNLFEIFGELDIDILDTPDSKIKLKINELTSSIPQQGKFAVMSLTPLHVGSLIATTTARVFVRQAYFLSKRTL